jgi:hypothetical protein
MSGLLQMPIEIWWTIVDSLDHQDQSRLARVCHFSHQATTPKLYENVMLDGEIWRKRQFDSTYFISSLLLSLLNHEEYRNACKTLCLRVCRPLHGNDSPICEPIWKPEKIEWKTSEYRKAETWIKSQKNIFPDTETVVQAFRTRDCEAWVAILVSLLPKLTYLHLSEKFLRCDSKFVSPLLSRMGGLWRSRRSAPLFECLRGLMDCFEPCHRGFWPNMECLQSLFDMPVLDTLQVVFPEPWDLNWPNFQAPASNVSVLLLHNCQIQPESLRILLFATPQLRVLDVHFSLPFIVPWNSPEQFVLPNWELQYGTREIPHASWQRSGPMVPNRFDSTAFVAALEPVRSSLLSLHVQLHSHLIGEAGNPEEEDIPPLYSGHMNLSCMTNLKYINVPLPLLLGWQENTDRKLADVLPPVERLVMGNFRDGVEESFESRIMQELEDYLIQLPLFAKANLTIIIVEPSWMSDDDDDKECWMLKAITLCREHQIHYSALAAFSNRHPHREIAPYRPTFGSFDEDTGLDEVEEYWRDRAQNASLDDALADALQRYALTCLDGI